jgi:predicted DCC family thiol-disulfide oxidoreductase YuxK
VVRFIIRNDPHARIRFAALQSEAGKRLLSKFDLTGGDINSVVYIPGDKIFLKSTAVLNIFRELGGGWRLFYGFIIIPRFIRDFIYNMIARNRYRLFGRNDICIIPDDVLKDRYAM